MSETKIVRFRKVNDKAVMPRYATDDSAGADLRSTEYVAIEPDETKLIPTGISMEIPKGYVGLLFPRSGLSFKTPLRQPNSVGVIDADYRGEVKGGFTNIGTEPVQINAGDRVAQMVIVPYIKADWVEVDSLDETERGEGGFGSTGTK